MRVKIKLTESKLHKICERLRALMIKDACKKQILESTEVLDTLSMDDATLFENFLKVAQFRKTEDLQKILENLSKEEKKEETKPHKPKDESAYVTAYETPEGKGNVGPNKKYVEVQPSSIGKK